MNEWARALREIRRLDGCQATKRRVLAILRGLDGRRVRCSSRAITHADMVRAAAEMIRGGMSRREVRDAMMERFGISRESAYGLMREALDAMRPDKQQELFRD